MAIFLGNKEPQWPNCYLPTADATMFPHWGMRSRTGATWTAPAFSDSPAGSGIIITSAAYNRQTTTINYYDKDGTASSANAWASGLTAADFTDADQIIGAYMDDNDECLYLLVVDTGTAPDSFKIVSVDKEGVVTQGFAWDAGSGTSFDYNSETWAQGGCLHRGGGDGSGTFEFSLRSAVIDGAQGAPYRGAFMSFALADGALTESHIMPDTNSWNEVAGTITGPLHFGPTSNNIYGGIAGTRAEMSADAQATNGILLNATTGVLIWTARYPENLQEPAQVGYANQGQKVFRWRSMYGIGRNYSYPRGGTWFAEDGIHTMLDEMAVAYGLL